MGQRDMIQQGRAAESLSQKGAALTDNQQAAKQEYEQWKNYAHPDAAALKKDAEEWRGNPIRVIKARGKVVMHFHAAPYYSPWNWDVWCMMFIGMGLFKLGVLSGARSKHFYGALIAIGYGIGLPLNSYTAWTIVRAHFDPVVAGFAASTYDIGRLSIAVGHLGAIMLLSKTGALGWLMSRLGALGQMAFSNYIFQSVVTAFLFTGYGFRLYGRLERYQLYYVVASIWIFQLIVSPIWLRHFRFGPLERGWRSLTYRRWQPFRLALIFIALAAAASTAAIAQDHHAMAPQEKPVALLSGLGTWRHPIATSNPEAQKFFDQGLALVYGFNRYEALRSFRKASELDPDAALPWWGMAMAQGPHINMDIDGDVDMRRYCDAAASGLRLKNAPPRERAYLEAANRRCPEERGSAYIDAMRALMEKYPYDPDAQTFFAESIMTAVRWRWYDRDGKPAPGVLEAERALEQVLRRFPDHPGANHLYIHIVESSPAPERAIPSAQRLMGIVPAAGHLVHMPGHIWMRLGDYETVAAVNERAAELDRRYMQQTGVHGAYDGYYAHNLQFLLAARWMLGRADKALQAADALEGAMQPMVAAMPDFMDPYLGIKMMTQLRFGQWDAVLAAPEPDPKFLVNAAMFHYGRAVALAHKHDRAGVLREQSAFETARAKAPPDRPWSLNKASDVLAMASEIVAAQAAETPAASIPHWKRAVDIEDGFSYDEPPPWYYPVRESLGAALLRAGRPAAAEAVYREGDRRTPHDGRMLFGLLQSLEAQGKLDAAEWVQREFAAAWRDAAVKLTIDDF
jgi:tetratricopeptide (TPR) repeat protein